MIERFFGKAARDRIEAAVRAAEGRTVGQVVTVVVERSDPYPEAVLRGALWGGALAGAAALVLDHWFPLVLAELAGAQLGAALLGALAGRWGPARRWLAGGPRMAAAVHHRALRAFLEQDLHHTVQGTGVLIFASLFERQAVVLGDHGIHAKVGDEAWQEAVALLTAGMRRGDPAGGFEAAIGSVGSRLAEHCPRAAGAPGNELPDAIRVDRE
jgi:putative membrane protein